MKFNRIACAAALLLAIGISFAMPRAARSDNEPRTISIVAHKYEFVPNQITVKKGETVKLELSTTDVKHGFLVKGLKIDETILPGKTTEVVITPDTAGTFQGACNHFCGFGHKKMKMSIVVEP